MKAVRDVLGTLPKKEFMDVSTSKAGKELSENF